MRQKSRHWLHPNPPQISLQQFTLPPLRTFACYINLWALHGFDWVHVVIKNYDMRSNCLLHIRTSSWEKWNELHDFQYLNILMAKQESIQSYSSCSYFKIFVCLHGGLKSPLQWSGIQLSVVNVSLIYMYVFVCYRFLIGRIANGSLIHFSERLRGT